MWMPVSMRPCTDVIQSLCLLKQWGRRRGGVWEEDSEGRRKVAGVQGVGDNGLVMLTGLTKSRHSVASFKQDFCVKAQHFVLTSVNAAYLKLHPEPLCPVRLGAVCMSCFSSHFSKLAYNPNENMLQLLIHPDSVFYALLRESPRHDILNEPCRKLLSSL